MCVPAGNAKEQVLAVFKHFNIQVNTSDIFSRCQVRFFNVGDRFTSCRQVVFALLVPSWCNKIDGSIRLVTRLF